MTGQTVITNNRPRHVLYWHELTEKERREFDYLNAADDDRIGASFARYRGAVYDLGEFQRAPDDLAPWHGYAQDTYFSATLYRIVDDGESVIMGRVYS